jgi:DNA-3-methyladenine glycosylase II
MKVGHKKKILYLVNSDPILGEVIKKASVLPREAGRTREDYFRSLIISIVNQQLSGKAAATIFKRFEELFIDEAKKKGVRRKKFPTPADVLKMPKSKLRKVGLSEMKVSFIKDLAAKIIDKTVNLKEIDTWTDEEVIEHLTRVKGIGRWTAEMFLMFSLGRDDVFSYGDLALRKAMQKMYKLKKTPTPAQAAKISAAWKPYRTLASRYLWASLRIE